MCPLDQKRPVLPPLLLLTSLPPLCPGKGARCLLSHHLQETSPHVFLPLSVLLRPQESPTLAPSRGARSLHPHPMQPSELPTEAASSLRRVPASLQGTCCHRTSVGLPAGGTMELKSSFVAADPPPSLPHRPSWAHHHVQQGRLIAPVISKRAWNVHTVAFPEAH